MEQSTFDPLDGEIHVHVKKPHNLNVTLDGEQNEKLDRLARAQGLSKSVIIRRAITWAYQHSIQAIPVCPDGNRCFCPQLHPPPSQAPQQTLVPQEPTARPVKS